MNAPTTLPTDRQRFFPAKSYLVFVASAILLFITAPFSGEERPVIAVIKSKEAPPYDDALRGFRRALEEKDIHCSVVSFSLDTPRHKGDDVVKAVAAAGPSLIVTVGTAATETAKRHFKKVPVLFCMVLNPVAEGLIASLRNPGNNLTGAILDIAPRAQFETIKTVVPEATTVGVLYNPHETGQVITEAQAAARALKLKLIAKAIIRDNDIPGALEELRRENIDVLWSVADSVVFNSLTSIQSLILFTLRHNIPFMGLSSSFVESGALMALSCDSEDNGYQAGEQAAELLSGKTPAEVPVAAPRRTFMSLNLRTADQIGIIIPPEVVKRAKETVK